MEIVPNGALVRARPTPAAGSSTSSSSASAAGGKGCTSCCGLAGHPGAGAVLRMIGADPLAVRLVPSRVGVSDEGVGSPDPRPEQVTGEDLSAKVIVAPSLGGESFGMVSPTRGLRRAHRRVQHRRLPRGIISPEDAAELGDLRTLPAS